jgi:WD40 repeat protein
VEVRDTHSNRLVARLRTSDFSRSVRFSPNGKLLATGLYGGQTQLWSTERWKPSGPPLGGHTARITQPEFSPDGLTLATASADGTVQLWDVATRKHVGPALTVDPDAFVSVAFTPDGSRLFAVSNQTRGVRFEVSAEAWKQHACRVAGRSLSASEWRDILPQRPFQPVCG